MVFDFGELSPTARYKLLVSTVVPRPIAWTVTQNRTGVVNAAPFSFFNAVAGDPPVVAIGFGSHDAGRPKDTCANIRDSRQFVVNLVSEDSAERMNITAIEFEPSVNEMAEAGLKTVPSVRVKPPRIAESPVAMECELMQIIELGPDSTLVLGRVLMMHIRDDAVIDAAKQQIDTPKLKLIARMHGRGWYTRTSDRFEMPRIRLEEWKHKRS